MSSVPPVNQRATVPARRVDDILSDEPVPAGVFEFYDYQGPDGGILFGCPCGCGERKSVAFRHYNDRRPLWTWNGEREKPTLSPSINIMQFDDAGHQTGEHWHGWLQDGVFKSC